jgi:hypothetical protein
MVAYNFQKQFVEPIRTGKKRHTIRKNGKRKHAKVGDLLQLYTGMRTRGCQKILEVDPVCNGVSEVIILVHHEIISHIAVDGFGIDDLEDFARRDGFKSLSEMHAFFLAMHGAGSFGGTLIEWRPA